MSQIRLSPKLIIGIIIAVIFGVALYLRIALPYDHVFSGNWIKLSSIDAYYFMHQVDNLMHNFPRVFSFDPYMRYPYGYDLGSLSFFVYLIGGLAWLIGLGSPTQHTIDTVAVYFPAIMGALTVIPVYFIGQELFNRWAGVLSAGLIAIMPGTFLGRSILGFADRDTLEVMLVILTMLFFILAVRTVEQRQLTFNHLRRWDWPVITKPLIYSLLAGIFLGLFVLTWRGALIFVFIISAYFIVLFIINHLRHKATGYLCFVSTVAFFVALMLSWLTTSNQLYLAFLVIALIIPLVLAGISRLAIKKGMKPVYYSLTLVGLGIVGLAIFYVISPSLLSEIMGNFGRIFAQPTVRQTTLESYPLFFPNGEFSLSAVWSNFTTGFFLSLISLGILIYFAVKRGETDKTLFIIWSLVVLVITLAMRRFALFFAINTALLSGYLAWLVLSFSGFKKVVAQLGEAPKPVEIPKKAKKKAKQKKTQKVGFHPASNQVKMALAVIFVFFLFFFPNIQPAVAVAQQVPFAPSDAWYSSLLWLKKNTPDPFGDTDSYYNLYERPFHYPETAYGVVAWWDRGYWIIRIGHRLTNCDPGGGDRAREIVARFFTAQDEASAAPIIDKLDSRYIIIDYATATGKFHSVANYAGSSAEAFYDFYYQKQEGEFAEIRLFYPEYYRSLAVRLYHFDGREVISKSSTVISYREKISPDNIGRKEITSSQSFSSYEEAEAYILSQGAGNYKIVSDDPFASPVPLKALEHYKLIYSSDGLVAKPVSGTIPAVKIFECIK